MNNLTTKEWVSIIIWLLVLCLFRNLGIVLAIVIACVVSFGFLAICDTKADSKSASTNKPSGKKQDAPVAPTELNIDNDYFLIRDGRLLEWRGERDEIIVPDGVRIIGGNDTPISKKTIHSIWIPKTVHIIADLALLQVETVHCEGSQDSLSYDKEYNFKANGWITDWSKDSSIPVRINEVSFYFNDRHYREIVANHYEKNPDELKPRSTTKMKTPNPEFDW